MDVRMSKNGIFLESVDQYGIVRQREWDSEPGDKFLVTGVLRNGRRFPAIETDNWRYANEINLYRGTKWLVRDGKRHKIVEV